LAFYCIYFHCCAIPLYGNTTQDLEKLRLVRGNQEDLLRNAASGGDGERKKNVPAARLGNRFFSTYIYLERDEKQLSHIESYKRFVHSLATDGEMDSLKLNPSVSIGYCASLIRERPTASEEKSPECDKGQGRLCVYISIEC